MTKYTRKFVAGFAAVALLASSFSGVALAGTTIEISGNGAGSDNWTTVTQSTNTTVTQTNDADVENNISSEANTGGNDAKWNTGGDVAIQTGNAVVDVNVANTVNSNSAEVDCCAAGDTEVKISGNGADSTNGVDLNQKSTTKVTQDNEADVDNNINSKAKTGYNDANSNTGGDVYVKTGHAYTGAYVSTLANVNSARVASAHSGNPEAMFVISENGAGSDNYIGAGLTKSTVLSQVNDADVDNEIDSYAKTGGNDAKWNTGGDVMIHTGDAGVEAMVDNAVNFNYADVDCGCTWDVTAKIIGNGANPDMGQCGYSVSNCNGNGESENLIALKLSSSQAFVQDNEADLDNDLEDLKAKTGYNDAKYNTGEAETDPAIHTGDAYVEAGVSNSGNVNSIGSMMDWNWPTMPEMEWNFNMAAMWAFFGLSF